MNDKEIILAANILFNYRLNKKGLKNLPGYKLIIGMTPMELLIQLV